MPFKRPETPPAPAVSVPPAAVRLTGPTLTLTLAAVIVTSPLAFGSKAKSPLIDWPRMASVPPVTLKDLVPLATVTRTPGCVEPGISISWSTSAPVSL